MAQPARSVAFEDATADLGSEVRSYLPNPGSPPLFIEPHAGVLADDLEPVVEWFTTNRDLFDRLIAQYGAVVLRGFPIADTDAFDRLVGHYTPHSLGYSGGATPRSSIKGSVYEATQLPPSIFIPLHQEMAYLKHYPVQVAFSCRTAPATGGETIIGDMRQFMAGLPDRFLSDLEDRGLTYHRNFRDPEKAHGSDEHPRIYHATLPQGFFTEDRAAIEQSCRALDMEFEWLPDGSLSTRLTKEAFAVHPLTGERIYFNHILTQIIDPMYLAEAYEPYLDLYDRAGQPRPYHVTYGDGSPIAESDYRLVADGIEKIIVSFPWQSGDVMLVDNIYTAHGRNPYTGTRQVEVALID